MKKELSETTKEIRRNIISMAHRSKGPHVGSALSCVDILAVLYFKVMRLEPWEKRDIFILSKAHAAMALYSTLASRGIIEGKMLEGYYLNNGTLPGHLDKFSARGIEASAGSLGHGFNIGLGRAFGFKRSGLDRKVYVLIGDGESQEGSIWEGALFASKLGLDNFTAILDYNNLQGYGCTREVCGYEPVNLKWEAFGWQVLEINGHDLKEIEEALKAEHNGKPRVIIAHTTKGRGVSFMEDQLVWHYYVVTDKHKVDAFKELA